MTLQEKIAELARESENVDTDTIEEEIGNNLLEKEDSVGCFLAGFEYACKCALRILEYFDINPEL